MKIKKHISKNESSAKVKETISSTSVSLIDRLERYFEKNRNIITPIIILINVLFGVFLFDVKISEANDDSLYVEGAYNFAKDFHNYFAANAPLYPMILSLPIKIFGLNIIILKLFSLLFSLLHIVFLYKAFERRVPYLVLFSVLSIISVNSYFQYFASQTFTESFFLMVQALLIWSFVSIIDHPGNAEIKESWKQWLILGLMVFIATLSKNLATITVLAGVFYFVIYRQWKQVLYFAGSFLLVRLIYEGIRYSIWGAQNQFSSQSSIVLQKDPYDPSKGLETMDGFISRLFDNLSIYLSKRLYQILGFISEDSQVANAGLAFITIILFVWAFVVIIRRKNKSLIITGIYTLAMTGTMCLALQIKWDQPRMIMVYVPLILMLFFTGMFFTLKNKSSIVQIVLPLTIVLIFAHSFIRTIAKTSDRLPVLKKNIQGDIYYGYTNDWINYLQMSAFVADSLQESDLVACRKAPMSFVYGKGKTFYPVYTVFHSDPDSVLHTFKEAGVTHVMVASLRRNPKKVDGYIINTMHRLLNPVTQKYPQKLQLIKQIGQQEPAYLYEIKY